LRSAERGSSEKVFIYRFAEENLRADYRLGEKVLRIDFQ
jgi:hypothetical protein